MYQYVYLNHFVHLKHSKSTVPQFFFKKITYFRQLEKDFLKV